MKKSITVDYEMMKKQLILLKVWFVSFSRLRGKCQGAWNGGRPLSTSPVVFSRSSSMNTKAITLPERLRGFGVGVKGMYLIYCYWRNVFTQPSVAKVFKMIFNICSNIKYICRHIRHINKHI